MGDRVIVEDYYLTDIKKRKNSLIRPAVANIDNLIDFGFDIIKIPHKGCYLGERVLEPSEVSFIVDALFSSKSISALFPSC